MKISKIRLENFKRFKDLEVDFINDLTQDLSDQFLILGDNGSGKTTLLQAIALCLSMCSGKIRNVSEFDWQGWVPERYEKWGTPLIELDVHFTDEEIQATKEVAQKWIELKKPKSKVIPNENKEITLRLSGEWVEVVGEKGKKSKETLSQLKGRQYATQLIKTSPWARDYFDKLPGFFWFDQFRNLATPPLEGEDKRSTGRVSYEIGVSRLRRYLNAWKLSQLVGEDKGNSWLMELENSYKKVFPGRYFHGLEPMHKGDAPTSDDYYFILSDGNRTYDIEEMSAGEQSIFPMLFEFVRMQIRNSVVLIDEVDLNLHPPLAQSLVNALPVIGKECQFIMTTHSESVSSIASPEEIHRLKGGRLCL
ncbi:AAA ATPase [Desulfamplus magnetovallimortis]|uniref:AAA ATPase n=1 Tax=Desulfamplus magnetovallimortis TaxID=1246637 RepID=A0A1W1HBM4_9BACT|nr:ATP-binding protein [Desulfamplus magnetovallimortis]SLM29880.1 AAA ATPase [Desulfamplus magnetovallimortis]